MIGLRRRVLLIDDDELFCRLMAHRLKANGVEVVTETDPRSALERFHKHPDFFELVVTDLSMPYIHGFELARALLAVRPSLCVIGMSSTLENVHPSKPAGLYMLLAKEHAVERVLAFLKSSQHAPVDGERLP